MDGSFPVSGSRARSKRALRRAQNRPRWQRLHPASRYLLLVVALSVVILIGELLVHTVTTDPRDARAIADRELALNTLGPGERVLARVSVFRRPGVDYFRATRGVLVLTDHRAIYLGVRPRDLLAPPDAPPTFDERDFPIDTLVTLQSGRTFFGIAKGIIVRAPDVTLRLGVPSDAWADAREMIASLDTSRRRVLAQGARQGQLQREAETQRSAALAEWRKPQYYTVQRGDALGAVATEWNVTTEMLQHWNELPDTRIRLGQRLLVRPGT